MAQRLRSSENLWNYFTRIEGEHNAICNHCSRFLTFKSSVNNLRTHLKHKHVEQYKSLLKVTPKSKSHRFCSSKHIWNYFTVINEKEKVATCHKCSKELSYKGTITNLYTHLKLKHTDLYDSITKEDIKLHAQKLNLESDEPIMFMVVENSNSITEDESHMSLSSPIITRTVEANILESKKLLWNFFSKVSGEDKIATCNQCFKTLSYRTSITNLKAHLNSQHIELYNFLMANKKLYESWSAKVPSESNINEPTIFTVDENNSEVNSEENHHDDESTSSQQSPVDTKMTEETEVKSEITVWDYFTKVAGNDKMATCNECSKSLSYRTSITNLKTHLNWNHKELFYSLMGNRKQSRTRVQLRSQSILDETTTLVSDEENFKVQSEECHSEAESLPSHESVADKIAKKNTTESNITLWDYFSKVAGGDKIATCNQCFKTLSYRTSITNLKTHLNSQHIELYNFLMANKNLYESRSAKVPSESNINEPTIFTVDENNSGVNSEEIHHDDESTSSQQSPVDAKMTEETEVKSEISVWDYFTKVAGNDKMATCNECSKSLSYRTSITNLKTHLNWNHKELFYSLMGNRKQSRTQVQLRSQSILDETTTLVSDEENFKVQYEECHSEAESLPSHESVADKIAKKNTTESNITLWDYFSKVAGGDKIATCNQCLKTLSYRTSITNLKTHLKTNHIELFNCLMENSKQSQSRSVRVQSQCNSSENPIFIVGNENSDAGSDEIHFKGEPFTYDESPVSDRRNSVSEVKSNITLWDYFTKVSGKNKIATCNQCSKSLSYKTSITNLKTHLNCKHIELFNILMANSKPRPRSEQLQSKLNSNESIMFVIEENSEVESEEICQDDESLPSQGFSTATRITKQSKKNIWDYFTKIPGEKLMATCNQCFKTLSCKTGITNLKTHLSFTHIELYNSLIANTTEHQTQLMHLQSECNSNEPIMFMIEENSQVESEEVRHEDGFDRQFQESPVVSRASKENMIRTKNAIWFYFSKVPNKWKIAVCNKCSKNLSYRTSITNLKTHLKQQHQKIFNEYMAIKSKYDSYWTHLVQGQSQNDYTSPFEFISANQDSSEGVFHSPQCPEAVKLVSEQEDSLWDYFTRRPGEDKTATCNLCSRHLSYRTSITNLKIHLKWKHVAQYYSIMKDKVKKKRPKWIFKRGESNGVSPSMLQFDLKKGFRQSQESLGITRVRKINGKKYTKLRKPLNARKKRLIDAMLIKYILGKNQPLSIVEEENFVDFIRALNPRYSLPTRKFISERLIPSLYYKCLIDQKKLLNREATTVCLTANCWTSNKINAFTGLSITAHFINNNFELRSVVLKCGKVNGADTGQNLAPILSQTIKRWGISEKIKVCVTNNARNIAEAISVLEWNHFNCIYHNLNETLKYALDLFEDILKKVKRIVNHYHFNSNAKEKLLHHQSFNSSTQPLMLITSENKRWNSTYLMIKRFVHLKDSVMETMPNLDSDLPMITDEEWTALKQLSILLKPFNEAMKELNAEKYVLASKAFAIVNGLKDVLEVLKKNPENYNAINSGFESIVSQLHTQFHDLECHDDLAMCTLLDPRYKMSMFVDEYAAEKAKLNLISEVQKIINEEIDPTRSSEETSIESEPNLDTSEISLWRKRNIALKERSTSNHDALSMSQQEVESYMQDEFAQSNHDPCEWWRSGRYKYPHLAKLFKNKCNIVANSVPVESLLSKTRCIESEKKLKLSVRKTEQLIFIIANLQNCDFRRLINRQAIKKL